MIEWRLDGISVRAFGNHNETGREASRAVEQDTREVMARFDQKFVKAFTGLAQLIRLRPFRFWRLSADLRTGEFPDCERSILPSPGVVCPEHTPVFIRIRLEAPDSYSEHRHVGFTYS